MGHDRPRMKTFLPGLPGFNVFGKMEEKWGGDGLINGGGEWRIPHHISIINFAFGERKMGKKAHRPNDCPAGEIRASRGRGTPPPIAKLGNERPAGSKCEGEECNNGGRRLKGGELDWKRQPRAIAKHQKINGENPFAFLFAHLIIDISVQIEGRPFFICSRLPHDLRGIPTLPPFFLDSLNCSSFSNGWL